MIHFFIIFIFSFSSHCISLKKDQNYKLISRTDDFIIFNNSTNFEGSKSPLNNELLQSFFKNIYYFKSSNLFSDKIYLFKQEIAESLSTKINEELGLNSSIFIIYKRDDPIAPFSRIYKTSFKISSDLEKISLEFYEIDKNIIFGNQYIYSDWSVIPDENDCDYKKNLFILDFSNNIKYYQSEKCSKDVYSNFYLYYKSIPSKSSQPLKTEDRINELNNLRKKGIISDNEYMKMRNKILNDL